MGGVLCWHACNRLEIPAVASCATSRCLLCCCQPTVQTLAFCLNNCNGHQQLHIKWILTMNINYSGVLGTSKGIPAHPSRKLALEVDWKAPGRHCTASRRLSAIDDINQGFMFQVTSCEQTCSARSLIRCRCCRRISLAARHRLTASG